MRDGDEWVIDGHKWFTSNGSVADFLIVMAVTNPDVHPYQGCSMIIVPADTPGVDIVRDVATMEDPVDALRAVRRATPRSSTARCGCPCENLIGQRGRRLPAGPAAARARAGSTTACAGWASPSGPSTCCASGRCPATPTARLLAEKQTIQNWVADSLAEMTAARLMTLQAAWKMDQEGAAAARVEIAMIKYYGAGVLYNVIDRAIQVHGSLGFSTDLPLESMYRARPGRPHLRRARRGAQARPWPARS